MAIVQDDALPAVATHPEEIKATFDMRVGKYVVMQSSARITPAGVISAGIATAAILLACGYLVASIGRRR